MTTADTARTNGTLVAQIRQAIQDAQSAGRPTPGRPTLVALTGATDHAVRKVLGELAAGDAPPPAPTGAPAETAGDPEPPAPLQAASAGGPTPTTPSDDEARANAAGTADPDTTGPDVTTAATAVGGRLSARVGFVFGSVTSVAANVLAARIPPVHAGPGWSPNVAAEIGAAVWPLILLLSVEILARVRWPRLWQWALAKFGGAGAVALGSAVISYGHIRAVLASWNYTPTGAGVGPLVVDGLMVISGFALLAMSHQPPTNTAASPGATPHPE